LEKAGENQKYTLPDGIPVWGGMSCSPSQACPRDHDVANYFGFDKFRTLVSVEALFHPHFDVQILEEDEQRMKYIDLDGVTRIYQKSEGVIPYACKWPISDWQSWNKVKSERLRLEDINSRFPANWGELERGYKERDYPLTISGYPLGLFGVLVHLCGYENTFLNYHLQPDLVKDMLQSFTDVWIAVWEEVLSRVEVDCIDFWEDISMGSGSMVSPTMIREFMVPHYKRIVGFLNSRGVEIILLDTDGDCSELVPLFLEAGITGMYPMETSTGLDILAIRKKYPTLQMIGGIPKSELVHGERRIDEILVGVEQLLQEGGYIPCGDHLIPPEVPWTYFKYYRQRLNDLIEKHGER
jgi:uroporphyrinogen decarboxylase